MNTPSKMKLSKVAIRSGCAGILAVVVAVAVQGAKAGSSDIPEMGASYEEPAPSSCTERNDEQTDDLDALDLAGVGTPTRPVRCCLPAVTGRERGVCRWAGSAVGCEADGGYLVPSCVCCLYDGCVAPTTDEGADEIDVDSGSNVASGWALLTIALLLLPIVPLARSRA